MRTFDVVGMTHFSSGPPPSGGSGLIPVIKIENHPCHGWFQIFGPNEPMRGEIKLTGLFTVKDSGGRFDFFFEQMKLHCNFSLRRNPLQIYRVFRKEKGSYKIFAISKNRRCIEIREDNMETGALIEMKFEVIERVNVVKT